MTIADLESRISILERQIADLAGKVEPRATDGVNAWINEIHGTFANDAAYRKAVRLGRQWRASHRPKARRVWR